MRFEWYFAPSCRFVELPLQRLIILFREFFPLPHKTSLKPDVLQDLICTLQVKELGIDSIFEVSFDDGQRLTYVLLQPVSYGSPQGRHH
jgi:hypothetical protein